MSREQRTRFLVAIDKVLVLHQTYWNYTKTLTNPCCAQAEALWAAYSNAFNELRHLRSDAALSVLR